ncbi:MAG: hypothetical protein FWG82_05115, partial [Oscillospiraceae bacterium]|nr:hypothetical protein [Oscillospiraceae bacterium]
MSDEKKVQDTPVPQMPYYFPYGYGVPPQGGGEGENPQPYPMFIPVPMYMPPYGMGMMTGLPQQMMGYEGQMPLNSYERQAGMQIVYQDGQNQGYPGQMPQMPPAPPMGQMPQMPMMMPYGYGAAAPFFPQGQPQNTYNAEDIQVLYQADDEDEKGVAPEAPGTQVPQEKPETSKEFEQSHEDKPQDDSVEGVVGSLLDLFDDSEIKARAGTHSGYSDDELAELFDEPFERKGFKQQLRDMFPYKSDSAVEKVRKMGLLTAILAIIVTAPLLLNMLFLVPMNEDEELKNQAGQLVYTS